MFNDLKVLIISSNGFQEKEVDKLQLSLENNGAVTYVKKDHDNTENFFEKHEVNHIITQTVEFIEYDDAKLAMIPITTPEWVYESIKVRKPLHTPNFNPDPRFFLKSCFICIGDDVPNSDKEIIYGGVRAFGGLYLDMLTSHTTHLITNDINSDKAILATSCEIDIKLVTPAWIDDCFKMGKKISEKPYLLEGDSNASSGDKPDYSKSFTESDVNNILKYNAQFFRDKKFYISNDYNLSKNLKSAVVALILKNGGKVASKFSNNIDIYLGKFRAGKEFQISFKSNRIIIGNLQWLYSVIIHNKWVLPTNSQLLHYPIPNKPLSDFKHLKISITNYSHDARYYLSKLITIMGGTFTKNLTKDNDILVVGRPSGRKYEAAAHGWTEDGKPLVKVVNHLWLEECFANWQVMESDQPKYQFLGDTKGIEQLLGRTKLVGNVLKNWVDSDVDDSMDEDLIKPADQTDYSSEEEGEGEEEEEGEVAALLSKSQPEGFPEISNDLADATPEPEHAEPAQAGPSGTVGPETTATPQSSNTPNQSQEKDFLNPEFTPARRSRSAKSKAALKLHDNMTDLIKHQELLKSSRKMTSYMKDLEVEEARKRKTTSSQDKENISPSTKKIKSATPNGTTDSQESIPSKSQVNLSVIMTGCESDLQLSKEDITNLKKYGVKISTSLNKINCLVAPKILRTEKFLTSLSKVDFIVHPQYLKDLSSALAIGDSPDIDMDDYRLDKIASVQEINEQLGYNTQDEVNGIEEILKADKGQLFQDYRLNLSSNLNGGYDVLSRILTSHGVEELKQVKVGVKSLCGMESEKIVIVNKAKDTKLIKSLGDSCTLVEWDWCVKSIFKQHIEPVQPYKV